MKLADESQSAVEASLPFKDESREPAVQGFLHSPRSSTGNGLILTHGAGGNSHAPLLLALAETFCQHNYTVLRCDLPFRQQRRFGPPSPGNADRDRAGLRNAIETMQKLVKGNVFLGGHSYGGRQSTLLCADEPELVSGLLLLSYPLHPPRRPEQLRIQHLPNLRTPCLFVHGTRDPFGSIEEIKKAITIIPVRHELFEVDAAGHDLDFEGKANASGLPPLVWARFSEMFG